MCNMEIEIWTFKFPKLRYSHLDKSYYSIIPQADIAGSGNLDNHSTASSKSCLQISIHSKASLMIILFHETLKNIKQPYIVLINNCIYNFTN